MCNATFALKRIPANSFHVAVRETLLTHSVVYLYAIHRNLHTVEWIVRPIELLHCQAYPCFTIRPQVGSRIETIGYTCAYTPNRSNQSNLRLPPFAGNNSHDA